MRGIDVEIVEGERKDGSWHVLLRYQNLLINPSDGLFLGKVCGMKLDTLKPLDPKKARSMMVGWILSSEH